MEDKNATQNLTPGERAAAYWFADGLPHLTFGISMFLVGVAGIVRSYNSSSHGLKWLLAILFMLHLLLYIRHIRVLDWVKARLTYPRTGYVSPPKEPPSGGQSRLQTLLAAPEQAEDDNVSQFRTRTVFVFFHAYITMGFFEGVRWAVPLVMAASALVVYVWNRDEPRPYSLRSVVPLPIMGLLTLWFGLPARSLRYIPFLIGGIWLLALGLATLVRYLRAHPKVRGVVIGGAL